MSLSFIERYGTNIDGFERERLRRLIVCTKHGRVSAEWVERQNVNRLALLVEVIREMNEEDTAANPLGAAFDQL